VTCPVGETLLGNCLSVFNRWSVNGSTVVEHSPHHPEVKALSLANTGLERNCKNVFFKRQEINIFMTMETFYCLGHRPVENIFKTFISTSQKSWSVYVNFFNLVQRLRVRHKHSKVWRVASTWLNLKV